jgi:hypothetical protein
MGGSATLSVEITRMSQQFAATEENRFSALPNLQVCTIVAMKCESGAV